MRDPRRPGRLPVRLLEPRPRRLNIEDGARFHRVGFRVCRSTEASDRCVSKSANATPATSFLMLYTDLVEALWRWEDPICRSIEVVLLEFRRVALD